MPQTVHIVNGPNLNLVGQREPGIYGTENFETLIAQLKAAHPALEIAYFQSNVEGELINYLQAVTGIRSASLLMAVAIRIRVLHWQMRWQP